MLSWFQGSNIMAEECEEGELLSSYCIEAEKESTTRKKGARTRKPFSTPRSLLYLGYSQANDVDNPESLLHCDGL